LVVLALNAPYYLDTTEISKLSLYLGTYSKVDPFIEAAVRAWFGELSPQGAPPVDVAGTNYNLQHQLSPDPGQTLPLAQLAPANGASLLPPVDVQLRAGPILDHNGHVVRDATPVTFYAEHAGGTYLPPVSAPVLGGVAEAAFILNEAGEVRFRAESGDARRSQVSELTIESLPTATALSSHTATPTVTSVPTLQPTPSPEPSPIPPPQEETVPPVVGPTRPVNGVDLWLAVGVVLVAAAVGSLLLGGRRRGRAVVVRWILLAIIGGMLGYILYALQVIHPDMWGILPQEPWTARAVLVSLVAVGAFLPFVLVIGTAHRDD
jgi:beta-N-acetylhexosaminidase